MESPNRRQFLASLPIAAAATGSLRADLRVQDAASRDKVVFGFITDVHHGTHGKDQSARLRKFIEAATARGPDFIIHTGDFCCAKGGLEACAGFLAEWKKFPGKAYHVIGNHDCDFQSKEELLPAWGIPNRYYSFDEKGFHFVVLDRNHFLDDEGRTVSYDKGNWYFIHKKGGPGHLARVSRADKEQLDWLAEDLASTDKPVVIFQHQPSGVGSHEGNWEAVNHVIDLHNARQGKTRVIAVLSGHDHDEEHAIRHGVHHLTLTSSTFGMPFGGNTTYYVPGRPPFTFITLDAARGEMLIEESASEYEGQKEMKPELVWVAPPVLKRRVLSFEA